MSEETMTPQPEKKGRIRRTREWIGGKIAGQTTERMTDTWNRIHKVGGFLPIFIEGKLEIRSQKMEKMLDEIETEFMKCKTPEKMQECMFRNNMRVFNLFLKAGTQWIRGLQDRELAGKVSAYLELFQRCGDNPAFTWDLYTCSIQMLNISFRPEDVESVPPYLIETKTVIQPTQKRGVSMDEVKEY